MWSNLAEDLRNQFALLEGCGARDEYGMFSIKSDRTSPEYLGRRREVEATWRKFNPHKLIARNARKRMARLKGRISEWRSTAQCICIGRDLDPNQWMEILTNPVSRVELEAFADFCFFLVHVRKTPTNKVAEMLQTNLTEVNSALSTRKVT